jgi:hypothetical protein
MQQLSIPLPTKGAAPGTIISVPWLSLGISASLAPFASSRLFVEPRRTAFLAGCIFDWPNRFTDYC